MKTYKFIKASIVLCLCIFYSNAGAQSISRNSMLLGSNPFEQRVGSALSPALNIDKTKKIKDPHTATMLAVFFPGSGQIYNGKYWKAPIVYAGLGISGYAIFWNKKEMKGYQDELDSRLKDTTAVNYLNLSIEQLKSNRNFYRTNRDLSIMSFVIIYALQIVDAAVDAHLSEYNLGEDMTLRVEPKRYENTKVGLGLTLTF